MNWNEIEGRWMQVRGEIKSKWGKLTDDDLTKCEGKRDRLVGMIQSRYSVPKEDASRQVDDWTSHLDLGQKGQPPRREPPPPPPKAPGF